MESPPKTNVATAAARLGNRFPPPPPPQENNSSVSSLVSQFKQRTQFNNSNNNSNSPSPSSTPPVVSPAFPSRSFNNTHSHHSNNSSTNTSTTSSTNSHTNNSHNSTTNSSSSAHSSLHHHHHNGSHQSAVSNSSSHNNSSIHTNNNNNNSNSNQPSPSLPLPPPPPIPSPFPSGSPSPALNHTHASHTSHINYSPLPPAPPPPPTTFDGDFDNDFSDSGGASAPPTSNMNFDMNEDEGVIGMNGNGNSPGVSALSSVPSGNGNGGGSGSEGVTNHGWVEFVEPKSRTKLYYNSHTQQAQFERPLELVRDSSDGMLDDRDEMRDDGSDSDDENEGSVSSTARGLDPQYSRRRRDSSIRLEAWQADLANESSQTSLEPKHTTPSTSLRDKKFSTSTTAPSSSSVLSAQRAAAAAAAANDAITEEDDSMLDEVLPADVRGGPSSTDPLSRSRTMTVSTKVMSVEKMSKTLSLIEKQVQLIMASAQQLAPQVVDELRQIRTNIENVSKALEQGATALDTRNDVDALTEADKLQWNFADNVHVDYYRAAAARVDHEEFEFKDWHAPQYFSATPLPPGVKTVTAVIKLPISIGPAPGGMGGDTLTAPVPAMNGPPAAAGGGGGTDAKLTHTRIQVSERDTAMNAIVASLAKCRDRASAALLDPNEFCLKAIGLHDYMMGDRLLFDYEYVRQCMRDGEQLKLALVRRPQPFAPLANPTVLSDAYRAKVKPDIRLLNGDDYKKCASNIRSTDSWQSMKVIPLTEVTLPFRVNVVGLDNMTESSLPRLPSVSSVYLRLFLFHGTSILPDSLIDTDLVPVTAAPRYHHQVTFREVPISQLPRGARFACVLFGKSAGGGPELMLGWVVIQLIDEFGVLQCGRTTKRLWVMDAATKGKHHKTRDPELDFVFRASTRENLSVPLADVPLLHLEFASFLLPVVAPMTEPFREPNPRVVGTEIPLKSLNRAQTKMLEDLQAVDSLHQLTPDEKALLWMARHSQLRMPHMLPKFLLCVNWGNPDHKFEAHRLLHRWSPPTNPAFALELLDAKYPDFIVREYAVNLLRRVPDDELALCLLQFVQCLKFESYHNSPLSRFLVERALRSPMNIGHFLFWHLKAELHDPVFCERFYVILEEMLSFCPRLAYELRKQNVAVQKLQRVAEMIVRLKREHGLSDAEATPEYVKELKKLNSDLFSTHGKFKIPLNPKLEATTLIVEKCRYMSSKMVPLWLVFKNGDEGGDAPPIYIIFKSGDDLRQDILTLQLLTVMDKLWLAAGLDMKMKPYRCIATGINETGHGVGMIEVVMNSDTTSGIQLKYGGGAVGALKDDPIDLFLIDNNKGKQLYEKAVDNFVCSCAGYCVATYVLGIGDRHNGNIMVTRDGHLFHIDFGHFLGNFKKKFGVNRERAAFVFTPEMAYVMGGKKYESHALFKKFLHLSIQSFNALRKNATWLEVLFILMSAAGMPELMKEKDIHYMRDKLLLSIPEKKADKKFEEEVDNSLKTTYRRIDNFIHIMRHG